MGLRSSAVPTSILIVDDDPDFADLLSDELSRIPGITVERAQDAPRALWLLSRNAYDLVVSDWALDGDNAQQMLLEADHHALNRPPLSKMPVLLISGSEKVEQTHALHALQHFEPVAFIIKRCGPALISLIAEHILLRHVALLGHSKTQGGTVYPSR